MGKDSSEQDEPSVQRAWKPVLGLSSEPGEPLTLPARAGTVFDQPEPAELIELTVIVPARNEEDCLGACLRSLVAQSDDIFELGRDWDLIVVTITRPIGPRRLRADFHRGHGDRGRQARNGLDGEGQCHLDGGADGARALAALYRCRHGSRAGRPAPSDA